MERVSNPNPKKPAANHPWRQAPSSEVVSWASKESYVRDVQNVGVARNNTLKRKITQSTPSR